jgi:hypothetical protein
MLQLGILHTASAKLLKEPSGFVRAPFMEQATQTLDCM